MQHQTSCLFARNSGRVVLWFFVLCLLSQTAVARDIFVAKTGDNANEGTAEAPYLTINHAAQVAQPGDVITVRAGDYREWVNPARGGTSEQQRIIYQAAPGEKVRIMGSELVTDWQRGGELWKVSSPESFFGEFNPFDTLTKHPEYIKEDKTEGAEGWGWLMYGKWTHRGEVYLNGIAFTEQQSKDKLTEPRTWFAETESGVTTIWAHFGDANPNRERTEINVREHGFLPRKTGLSYITVRGFDVMHIACHWAPPIAFQPGAICPNGGHHWIIEDNYILHAKAVGISLGNPSGNASLKDSGYHIVRNNIIRRCGQAAVAGDRWNKYSRICGNIIEDVNYRREFGGWETAGIKIHNSIGVLIDNNYIRGVRTKEGGSAHGLWIDYGNLYFQVSRNVISETDRSAIMFEANWNGPFLIDNNILIGGQAASQSSQGEVWVHNLLVDVTARWNNQNYGSRPPVRDAKWFNNVLVGQGLDHAPDVETFSMNYNLFLNGAKKSRWGNQSVELARDPGIEVHVDQTGMSLGFDSWAGGELPENHPQITADYVELPIRDNNGMLTRVESDFFGNPRDSNSLGCGPFSQLGHGRQQLKVFEFPEDYEVLEGQ